MSTAASQWKADLESWAIPAEILLSAPESPWIHPPTLFALPEALAESPSHQRALDVEPADVLDVGCGGGLAAFALAEAITTAYGVDHQQEMLDMFAQNAEARGLVHKEFLGDWPEVAPNTPVADVVTCHHVAYNVQEIEPFLAALNDHARKRVVIEIPQHHPLTMMSAAWRHFWNVERPTKPVSQDLLGVIADMGIRANIEHWESPLMRMATLDDEVKFTRIRLCLPESRDEEIREFLSNQMPTPTRSVSTIWWDVN